MEHEIDQPKGKSESTNNKDSTSRNNVDNDTMEYEFEPTINRNESKGKNIQFIVIIYTTNQLKTNSSFRDIKLNQRRYILFSK